MDETITISGQVSTSLRSRRKSCISVSTLASDILLNIFFVLRDLYAGDSDIDVDEVHFWDWTNVAKICRHWRNVALECAGLWSVIWSSRHLDESRTFLNRSGQVDLKVNLNIRDPDEYTHFDLLKGHMWRIRELKIAVFDENPGGLENLLSSMTQHTKILNLCSRLKIKPRHRYHGMLSGLADSPPTVQLTSLSLKSTFIPWSSSLYHGLVELSISDPLWLSYRPRFPEFIGILEHCPKLQYLALNNFWPNFYEMVEHRLDLPLLKNIILSEMQTPVYVALLKVLPIRDDLFLRITFHRNISRSPLQMLAELLKKRKSCKMIEIGIEMDKLDFTVGSNVILDNGYSWTNFEVSIYDYGASQNPMAAFNILLGDPFWKTADAAVFSFRGQPLADDFEQSSEKKWGSLLENLPASIKSLTFKYSPAYNDTQVLDSCIGLSEALAVLVTREYDTEVEAETRLLELETLTFDCVDLGDRRNVIFDHMERRSKQARLPCTVRFTRPVGTCMETEEFIFDSKR